MRDLEVQHRIVHAVVLTEIRLVSKHRRSAVHVLSLGTGLTLIQGIKELLVDIHLVELLDRFARITVKDVDTLLDALERLLPFRLLFAHHIEIFGGRLSFTLDLVEEVQELLGVLFKHGLRTTQAIFLHVCFFGKALNFLLLGFKHHANETHLTLLLDQCPARVAVLRALDRDVEVRTFALIDEVLNLRINGELRRLDISFAYFTEAAFSDRFVLLPDLERLVLFSVEDFAVLLGLFEGENHLVESVDAEWVLFVDGARAGPSLGGV